MIPLRKRMNHGSHEAAAPQPLDGSGLSIFPVQVPEQSGGGICTGKILPPPKLELRGIAGTAEVRRSSEILSVNKQNSSLCGAPNLFIAKHAADVIGNPPPARPRPGGSESAACAGRRGVLESRGKEWIRSPR